MQIAKLLGIDDVGSFKLHAARFNQVRRPLDVFLEDKQEWNQWNSYFGKRHEFNRPFLLSLIDFYPEKNVWLFGGIYKIQNFDRRPQQSQENSHAYNSELTEIGSEFIGRLKVRLALSRGRTFNLEGQINKMELVEILRFPYTGPSFTGYDKASLIFSDLTTIVQNDRQDWKTALGNMKGVYLSLIHI